MKYNTLIIRHLVHSFFSIVIIGVCLCLLSVEVQASVSISISPIAGGTTLRFGRSDVESKISKELRVRLTSTGSDQYQVFQRWIQPLSSPAAFGIQQNFLKFYGLSGSNGAGTLYGQIPEFITVADQLVYTSTIDGDSDAFILVFNVDKDRLRSSGQYTGRLLLTIRPIGSGQIQEAYLDVFIDADLNFDFKIGAVDGGSLIRLDSNFSNKTSDSVVAAFEGNAGEMRVYQEVLTPISSVNDPNDLAKGFVTYQMQGDGEGIKVRLPKVLDFGRELIYQSRKREDAWDIVYEFNSDQTFPLKAGTYRGKIRYSVESGNELKDFDFDIEIRVDPVFEIQLEFPDGGVAFTKLFPGAPPQERIVHVKVNTNLQKPYAVSQNMTGPLKNTQQKEIRSENFLMKLELEDEDPGKSKLTDFIPVPSSKSEYLYMSDSDGTPSEFEVYYRVDSYVEMSSGDYQTEIRYTLEEI